MEYKRFGNSVVARLDRGDEVVACLTQLCQQEDIRLAQISGLGAVDYVKAGIFYVDQKRYHQYELTGPREIVSLTGSATRKDGEVYLHIHIAVSDGEGAVLGGHLNEARISATGEIILMIMDGEVGRRFDAGGVHLNLFDFGA
ncbi:MAG: PPC domain-containing DNA-binding protein [Oscillospiraceae bacterium]